jgi:hypothetical protein
VFVRAAHAAGCEQGTEGGWFGRREGLGCRSASELRWITVGNRGQSSAVRAGGTRAPTDGGGPTAGERTILARRWAGCTGDDQSVAAAPASSRTAATTRSPPPSECPSRPRASASRAGWPRCARTSGANDATNQQRPQTEIYYEPGFREQAQTAAGCLDVGLNRIHPMTANARVVGDRADIVVFIGADKAR